MKIEPSSTWKQKWRVRNDAGKIIADDVSKSAAKLIADTPRRIGLLDKVKSGEVSVRKDRAR